MRLPEGAADRSGGRRDEQRAHKIMLASAQTFAAKHTARVLMLRSLNHRLRDAVSMGGRRRMVAHLFRGQMGCMKLRRH